MPKESKKIWEDEKEKDREAEKDQAIKEMRRHPGSFITGPVPPGLEKIVEQLRLPFPIGSGEESPPPVGGDKTVNALLAKIKELTK